jgi:hypothetical protein
MPYEYTSPVVGGLFKDLTIFSVEDNNTSATSVSVLNLQGRLQAIGLGTDFIAT